jgi:hypothetical protein
MEFVPWKAFGRILERHKGDVSLRTLGCADLFRIMAFSQLTWRESLRGIEVCLEASQFRLFHMGIKAPPARSALADALNLRDGQDDWASAGPPFAASCRATDAAKNQMVQFVPNRCHTPTWPLTLSASDNPFRRLLQYGECFERQG